MKLLDSLRFRLSTFFRRSHLSADMEDELRSHIQHRADDLERSGIPGPEAARRARLEFGGQARFKEESLEAAGGVLIESIFQDLRYAVRLLRKSPSFTVAAVLTLAVAIGANSVVFGALNALVLRPLSVPQPQSLYSIERATDKWACESYPNYLDLRDRNSSFEDLAAYNMAQASLDSGENPARPWLFEVTGNYFDVLGLRPYLGRFFHASDEHGPNSAPYVVVSFGYWHSHFRDDPGVIGRTVQLNKHPFTVLGVSPPGFRGTLLIMNGDLFVPIINQEQIDGENFLNARGNRWVFMMLGHLKPAVTTAQATADLNSIGSYLEKTYPNDYGQNFFADKNQGRQGLTFLLTRPGLAGDILDRPVQAFVAGLMLLAALILLAACANLGSLFVARAADRSREIALRLALGSTRLRILRQLFTEAILISLVGGAIGLWGSISLLSWLSAWQPFPQFPLNIPVSPDANVYIVATLLALLSGFLFGAAPVRQVLHTDPYQIVKAGSSATARRRITGRDLLIAVQIAICAVLVTSSMVAVRGLVRSLHSNFGFDPRNVLLAQTVLDSADYSGAKEPAMQKRMLDAMETIPGVTSVGLVDSPPLHMGWATSIVFTDRQTDLRPADAAATVIQFKASPGYFRAAGTALLSGRTFTWQDDKNAPRIAVVNQEFARRLFGSASSALGSYYKTDEGVRTQVVGIVEDGKYTANLAEDPQAAVFLPLLQAPSSETWMVVRSARDSQQLTAAVKSKLHDLDAGLPSFIQTWNESMNGALFAPRVATVSLGLLGSMGAMLSVTGIFGMAAHSVSTRKRELGIRMALGAQSKEVLKAALGRPFKLLVYGSAVGLILGILASRVLAFIVYQATPRDPLVLAGVVLAMFLLGMLATWVPAQRALSVDPSILMREE